LIVAITWLRAERLKALRGRAGQADRRARDR
jgi:hypothetical protein